MNNLKQLLAGFALGLVLAIAPSCGTTKACSSVTCSTGCCDAKGECQAGTSNSACGQLGGTCQVCQIAQACSLGTCAQTNGTGGNGGGGGATGGGGGTTGGGGGTTGGGGGTTGGGGGTMGGGGGTTGGGGGTTGGGGGTTGGGGGTCDGCFYQGSCIIRANSNNDTLCGQGGVQCATCVSPQTCQNYVCTTAGTGGGGAATGGGGGTTCDGCRLPSGSCVPSSLSGSSVSNCGLNGVACVACGSGQLCTSGLCQTPGVASIGSPCNTNADCSTLALTTMDQQVGITPYCKQFATDVTATTGQGVAYTGGYCTKRCGFEESVPPGSCGSTSTCSFLLGDIGEADNVCFKNCVTDPDCRPGYFCLQYTQTSGICLPETLLQSLPDGGTTLAVVDPGPGFSGTAGASCALDSQCQPPSNGVCIEESLDAGYVGGACTAECTATWSDDSWCGLSGLCSPAYAGRDSLQAPVIRWFCERGCGPLPDGGIAGTCRAGYVCEGTNQFATCVPRCTNSGVVCGTGKTCSSLTGLCQ